MVSQKIGAEDGSVDGCQCEGPRETEGRRCSCGKGQRDGSLAPGGDRLASCSLKVERFHPLGLGLGCRIFRVVQPARWRGDGWAARLHMVADTVLAWARRKSHSDNLWKIRQNLLVGRSDVG